MRKKVTAPMGDDAMKHDEEKIKDKGRRKFLQGTVSAGAGAAVVVAVPGVVAGTETEKADEKSAKGYRLTQHILDYYKSASS